jgi:deoxyhypusine synthase
MTANTKAQLLQNVVEHVDITSFDARPIIDSMRKMSSRAATPPAPPTSSPWPSRTRTARLADPGRFDLGRRLHARVPRHGEVRHGGRRRRHRRLDRRHGFLRGPGLQTLSGAGEVDDNVLRDNYIDRIYDTYIDEEELQACDHTILEIANRLEPRGYSSREFIWEMGKWLSEGNAKKPGSLIQTAYEEGVPIFCPAFVDSSAGFGLVKHQKERAAAGQPYLMLDAIADFRELTDIKIAAGVTGLFMVGGGVPKNFAQDTVVCAEILGVEAEMHRMRSRSPSPTSATAPARPRR